MNQPLNFTNKQPETSITINASIIRLFNYIYPYYTTVTNKSNPIFTKNVEISHTKIRLIKHDKFMFYQPYFVYHKQVAQAGLYE